MYRHLVDGVVPPGGRFNKGVVMIPKAMRSCSVSILTIGYLPTHIYYSENNRSGYVEVSQNLFHANDCRSEFSHARSCLRNSMQTANLRL